ncbi:MAG: hypothetical protein ACFFB0_15980 [Promethearchaeota archaeon]
MKETQKKILITFSFSLIYGICVLFIGLIISFTLFYVGIDNQYLNKIEGGVDRIIYEEIVLHYKFNDPIYIQFINYLLNFFKGDWGNSYVVAPGMKTIDLLSDAFSHTIVIAIFPIIIGVGGIKLGKIWARKTDRIQGKIIQIFTTIALATPIFFIGNLMQYIFQDTLPISNYILAIISLSFVFIAIIIKQTCISLENKDPNVAFVSNSFIAAKLFGYIFAMIILLEIIFQLPGFGYNFIMSIYFGDLFVNNSSIFIIVILFTFTIFLSNLVPIGYKFLREKAPKLFELFHIRDDFQSTRPDQPTEMVPKRDVNLRIELKNYGLAIVKNPYTIVGLGLIVFFIIISLFPQLFTPYKLQELVKPYFPDEAPFSSPSEAHPLGTTKYGYDLLARLIWGTRDAFIFGSLVLLIGLIGGSFFGVLASKFHGNIYNIIIGFMIVFFIIPAFWFFIIISPVFDRNVAVLVFGIGIFLVIIFIQIIANAIRYRTDYLDMAKRIIKYIPLEMAFAILLYQSLGFIGLADERTAQLGTSLSYGRAEFEIFRVNIWPSFFIFLIMLSLILLHEGLNTSIRQKEVL